jgi:hypothetical protein
VGPAFLKHLVIIYEMDYPISRVSSSGAVLNFSLTVFQGSAVDLKKYSTLSLKKQGFIIFHDLKKWVSA